MNSPNNVATRSRGQRRRQEIIESAIYLIQENGYQGVTLREVAKRINIRIGNLQYYFRTKQDLLLAIFEHQRSIHSDNFQQSILEASSKSAQLLMLIDRCLISIKNSNVQLWRLLVALAQHDEDAAKVLRKEQQHLHSQTSQTLMLIDDRFNHQHAEHLARCLWVLIDGLTLQLLDTQDVPDEVKAIEYEARVVLLDIINRAIEKIE